MNTLDSIAKSHGTDKSSEVHNYCAKYEKYLPFKRCDKIKILEIGVFNGQSLKTWSEYFYNSEVVGIDIDPNCKAYEGGRIHIEIESQTNLTFLDSVCQKYGEFDLIIDDGSHINADVIATFNHLFKKLKSGGVYIVEDSCTSYWKDFGGGYLKHDSTIEFFKRLIDDVNFRGLEYSDKNIFWYRGEKYLTKLSEESQPSCRIDIESINFLNSLILITKTTT